jgi:tetratricopeptide (TPR) repeat protein
MPGKLPTLLALCTILLLSPVAHLVAGEEELEVKFSHNAQEVKEAMQQCDLNKAEDLLHEMVHAWVAEGITDTPSYAAMMGTLANIYAMTGDYARAEARKKDELEIQKNVLGEKHEEYINTLREMAVIYLGYEQYDAAERTFRDVHQSLKKEAREGLELSFELGLLNALKGDSCTANKFLLPVKEPIETGKRTITSKGEFFGLKYFSSETQTFEFSFADRYQYKLVLALLYAEQRSYPKSCRLLREMANTSLPKRNLDSVWESLIWEKIGKFLYSATKYEEAKLAFDKSLSIRKKLLPPHHPVLLRTMKLYASALAKTGNKVAAVKIRKSVRVKTKAANSE